MLYATGVVGDTAMVAGRGWHGVQTRKPIRPDMRLHGRATVVEQELRERDGVIGWRMELRTDDGELVLSFVGVAQVLRRNATRDSSSASGASNIG